MGWGSALVGHGRPEITEAVIRQAPLGANFAYVNENALALAEEIIRVSPACERIRFCASGTEATMYCQRLARAYTGRTVILKRSEEHTSELQSLMSISTSVFCLKKKKNT